MPERIQLSRRRGWRMPENTVSVARPTRFGNPFRIGNSYPVVDATGVIIDFAEATWTHIPDAATAVELYREWLTDRIRVTGIHAQVTSADLRSIHGKNLACWCALDAPCHADVLLELANGGAS